MTRIVEYAPAKLNLALAVSTQIVDQRHLLNSVFTTIDLADRLVFNYDARGRRAIDIKMTYTPGLYKVSIPKHKNIVYQAVQAFEKSCGTPLRGRLFIEVIKQIPTQAGLGGGSSDAAATLLAMQQIVGIKPSDDQLLHIAASLGSDVGFFLQGGCAWMTDHGQIRQQSLYLPTLDVVLVKPELGLSTALVYAEFHNSDEPAADIAALAAAMSAAGDENAASFTRKIAPLLSNNLTAAAVRLAPPVGQIIGDLSRQPGIITAQLTGTGSAVFGLADSRDSASRAAAHFRQQGFWTAVCRTTPSNPQ